MYGASLGIFNAYVPSTAKFHPNRITQQSYDVTSIFQDGGRNLAIILPISFVVISLNQEGRNLPAYQISTRYLNPRLRYNYFRFLKSNVRHFGILFPAPIFTLAIPWAYHFVCVYRISSKSDHPRQSYISAVD